MRLDAASARPGAMGMAPASAATGLAEGGAGLAAAAWAIERRFGLDFASGGLAALQDALGRAAAGCRVAPERFVADLAAGRLRAPELGTLVGELTVGETYFWRDPATFEWLLARWLPERLRRRSQAGETIALWSAGCSSGEEAFSLAMAIDQLVPAPEQGDWGFDILASDLNPQAIAQGRRAVYGKWSFRGLSASAWPHRFEPASGDGMRVVERLRRRVRFEVDNLVDAAAGGDAQQRFDLIFCRNVLMYLSEAQQQTVVARLVDALLPGGYLCVAPVEAGLPALHALRADAGPGLPCLRRPPLPRPVVRGPPPAPQSEPTASAVGGPAPTAGDGAARAGLAEQLAADGEHQAAGRVLREWLDQDPLAVDAHCLQARIAAAKGDDRAAARAWRLVLSLAPRHVPAWLGLAAIARRDGCMADARRHERRAARAIAAGLAQGLPGPACGFGANAPEPLRRPADARRG